MTFGRQAAVVTSAVLAACVGAARARAQAPTGTVTGRVTGAGDRPLAGARVSVVGTAVVGTTREDGRFTLARVPAGARRLRVALIGYAPREVDVAVAAGQPASVDVALQASAISLSEVVVVGYGTQRRADVTGAVSSVNTQQLQQTAVNSLEQGLQGRVAGVQVTQGDPAPGGGMRVQVRGVNSMNSGSAQPLYVIDGVPVSGSGTSKTANGSSQSDYQSLTETNPLAQLAPSDIESIDILKDASATAIYGSRGANGVVLITTKRGRQGQPGQVAAQYSQGFSGVPKTLDVLDAHEYAAYVNKAYANDNNAANAPYGGANRPRTLTPDSIRALVGAGSNWQDEVFRTALVRDAQISFSGGDQGGGYLASANLLQLEGVVRGSLFRRGGVRMNLDRSVNERLRVQGSVTGTRTLNNMVRSATINGYQSPGIVRQALRYTPFQLPDTTTRDPRAEDPSAPATLGTNPLRYTDEVKEQDQATRAIAGLRGVYQLGRGLALDVNLGSNYERRPYSLYLPRTVAEGRSSSGVAVTSGSEFSNILDENILRYSGTFGRGQSVEAIAGFTYQADFSNWNYQEVSTFANDILGANVLQNGQNPARPQTGASNSMLASWLGRVNYSLLDRYLLTATVRRDGSSKFAANNKWSTFPAVALGWRVANEPLMKRQSLFSELKVRLSYGKSGNQAIGPYQSLAQIGGQTLFLNGVNVPAFSYTTLANPDLRWETTDQVDAGLDFGLWRDRLTGSVDVYRKNTYDLLQQIRLSGTTGFGTAWINSGNVTNRGVEMALTYNVLNRPGPGGVRWSVTGNASQNRNRIRSLGPITQQFAERLGAGGGMEVAPFIQKPGLPIGAMWGYVTDGIIKSAADSASYAARAGSARRVGDLRYRDVDGDNKITAADQTVIGDANPKWVWGVTNSFNRGKFDASFLVTAVRGNDVIRVDRLSMLVLNGSANVQREFVANAWDPVTNPDGRYPMVRQSRQVETAFNDLYVEDGSFVRLKNVQLGYRVPLRRAQSARVFVNAVNLLTWTKYGGYDPEVSAFGSTAMPGVDQGSYPQSRTVSVGVSTQF